MAGTVVETITSGHGRIEIITLTCTADAADGSYPATALTNKFSGQILQVETDPGSPAPTASYDIVLTNAGSYDVIQGLGANRHTSNTETVNVVFSGTGTHPMVHVSDTLTWTITNNSVNSAVVVAKIYILTEGQ